MITLNQSMGIEQNSDTDSFSITKDFYKYIANDVKRWFDTSNYDENDDRPLPIGRNKKLIGLFKDELEGKNHTYAYGFAELEQNHMHT